VIPDPARLAALGALRSEMPLPRNIESPVSPRRAEPCLVA
jgi:hypothetical protein